MGCGSFQLINKKQNTHFRKQFKGILLDLMMSDVAIMGGFLWSVTDKDIDLVTIDILKNLDLLSQNKDLETFHTL